MKSTGEIYEKNTSWLSPYVWTRAVEPEPEPKQFGWLQSKTFRWCNQSRMAGVWNLDSGSTALVWGASQLCKQYNGFQFSMDQGRFSTKGEGEGERHDEQVVKSLVGRLKVPTMTQVVSFDPKYPKVGIWGSQTCFLPWTPCNLGGSCNGPNQFVLQNFCSLVFIANSPENSSKSWKIREISTTGKQTDQKLERRPKRWFIVWYLLEYDRKTSIAVK